MIALLIAPALAADATGLRLDNPSPGGPVVGSTLGGLPGQVDAGMHLNAIGEAATAHYDDGSTQTLLANVVLLDFAAAYQPGRRWRVEAGIPLVASADVGEQSGGVAGDLWLATSYAALESGDWRLGPRLRGSAPVSPWGPLTTEGGPAGSLSLVTNGRVSVLDVTAEAGIGARPESALGTGEDLAAIEAGGLLVPLGVEVSCGLSGAIRGGVAVAGTLSPIGGSDLVERASGEALAHLEVDLRRVDFVAGFGLGLGSGLGAPQTRTFLGVRGRLLAGLDAPADSDADGVLDADDRCRDIPEDKDGFHDGDGCPDTDDDRDGIADASDQCPHDPEDIDAFEDSDGCVEPDNDRDGINDGADDCPLAAGPAANRGCPLAPGRVRVTAARIEIDDRVYFDTGRATIQEVSFPLLREVAAAINATPEVLTVQVAGHTDNEGDDAANLALSQARADAVRLFLVTYGGVDPARLEARGFGETMPVASNQTEEGRAQNRRVEFVIVRRR